MTVDPQQRVLYLSKKNCPEDVAHHKLYLTDIVLWPYYNPKHIGEEFYSKEAALTVRLKGYVLSVRPSDRCRLADGIDGTVPHPPNFPHGGTDALPSTPTRQPTTGGKRASWTTRCTSLYAFQEFMKALTSLRASNSIETLRVHGNLHQVSVALARIEGAEGVAESRVLHF